MLLDKLKNLKPTLLRKLDNLKEGVDDFTDDIREGVRQSARTNLLERPALNRFGDYLSGRSFTEPDKALIAPVVSAQEQETLAGQVQKELASQGRTQEQKSGIGQYLAPFTSEETKQMMAGTPTGAGRIGIGLLAGASLIPDFPSIRAGKATKALLKEARKYKSAEEFIKSSDFKVEYATNKLKFAEDAKPITVTVYHGSPDARFAEEFMPNKKGYFKDAPDLLPDNTQWNELYGSTGGGFKTGTGVYEGISFSDDFRVAKSYADKPAFDSQNSVPMVLERTVTLNKPKVIDVANGEWKISLEKTIEQAKKEGYDGIIFKNIKDNYHPSTTQKASNNIIAFSPDQIKTKSQLEDIWKQANKATPETSLLAEARKYKSAEEFVRKVENATEGVGSIGKIADSFSYKKVDITPRGNTTLANIPLGNDGKYFDVADGFADKAKVLKDSEGNIFAYLKEGTNPEKLSKKTRAFMVNNYEPWNVGQPKRYITTDNGKTWQEVSAFELGSATSGMSKSQLEDIWRQANK